MPAARFTDDRGTSRNALVASAAMSCGAAMQHATGAPLSASMMVNSAGTSIGRFRGWRFRHQSVTLGDLLAVCVLRRARFTPQLL